MSEFINPIISAHNFGRLRIRQHLVWQNIHFHIYIAVHKTSGIDVHYQSKTLMNRWHENELKGAWSDFSDHAF